MVPLPSCPSPFTEKSAQRQLLPGSRASEPSGIADGVPHPEVAAAELWVLPGTG